MPAESSSRVPKPALAMRLTPLLPAQSRLLTTNRSGIRIQFSELVSKSYLRAVDSTGYFTVFGPSTGSTGPPMLS